MDIDIARYRADSFELTRYVYVYIERESGGERGGGGLTLTLTLERASEVYE